MSRAIATLGPSGMAVSSNIITGWPFSIAYWIQIADVTNNTQRHFEYCNVSGETDYAFIQNSTGNYALRDYTGSTNVVGTTTGTAFNNNTWYPVVMRCDTAATESYAGQAAGGTQSYTSTTNKGTFATPSTPNLTILDGELTNNNVAGKVAYFTIWSSYLSDANRDAFLTATDPSTIDSANQIAYWDFQTSSLTDSIGSLVLSAGGSTYDSTDNPTLGGGGPTAVTISSIFGI